MGQHNNKRQAKNTLIMKATVKEFENMLEGWD